MSKRKKNNKNETPSIISSIKSGFYDGIKGSISNAVKAVILASMTFGATISMGAGDLLNFYPDNSQFIGEADCRDKTQFSLFAVADSKEDAKQSFQATLNNLELKYCSLTITTL